MAEVVGFKFGEPPHTLVEWLHLFAEDCENRAKKHSRWSFGAGERKRLLGMSHAYTIAASLARRQEEMMFRGNP